METPARQEESTDERRSSEEVEDNPHLVLLVLESSSTPWMDGQRWQSLPHDILVKVLLRLPSVAHVRLRAVSRSWHALLSSTDFLRRSAHAWATESDPAAPARASMVCAMEYRLGRRAEPLSFQWICDMEYRQGRQRVHPLRSGPYFQSIGSAGLPAAAAAAVDGSCRVHKLPLTFLPVEFRFWKQAAAQDGLVCVEGHLRPGDADRGHPTQPPLCVFNPVTRQYKVLSTIPHHHAYHDIIKVQAVASGGGFKVIVAGGLLPPAGCRDPYSVRVYSSDSQSWWTFESARLPRVSSDLLVDVPGTNLIYNLLTTELHDLDDPPSLPSVPRLSHSAPSQARLVGYVDDVFKVGQTTASTSSGTTKLRDVAFTADNATSFGVWKLDRGSAAWHLVSEMPHAMCKHLQQPVLHKSLGAGAVRLFFEDLCVGVAAGSIFFVVRSDHLRRHPSVLKRRRAREVEYLKNDHKVVGGVQIHYFWNLVGFHLRTGTWQVYLYNVPGKLDLAYRSIKFMDFGGNHYSLLL